MDIYIKLNTRYQNLQNHISFICKYIELYHIVKFKYSFDEKITIGQIEFETSEKKLSFEFNEIHFSENIAETTLTNLWRKSFFEIQRKSIEQPKFDILGFIFTYMNLRDELYVPDIERTKYGNVNSYKSLHLKKEHYHLPIVDIVIDKFIINTFNLNLKYKYPTYVRTSDCDSVNFKNTGT